MRICQANNYLAPRGGSERVMFMEAELLRDRGHAVTFFGRRGPHDVARAHAAFYPPLVEVERLTGAAKWRHAPRVIHNAATARAFQRFLAATRPELLHAHNIYGGLTPAILAVARAAALPVVLTVHDYKLVCPSYLALARGRVCSACAGGRFYRCLLARCHKRNLVASALYTIEAYWTTWRRHYDAVRRFICPSRFMRQTLLDAGYAPARVVYLPNAVVTAGLAPAIGRGEYVLFVGRLTTEKGAATLLNALRGLTLPARIVGDGPLRADLTAQAARDGLGDRVVFDGHLTGAELADAYRRAAFLVIPSEWRENAPLSVLEAFAHGKPVIGADIGGIPELVVPEQTGLLFPPGDASALRAAIATLWRDRAAGAVWGANARGRAESEFAPARHVDGLLALYAAAAAETAARPAGARRKAGLTA